MTFLLRSLRSFDENDDIRHYVALGNAHLVQGDALNPDDVKSAWEKAAGDNEAIDFVIFSVGAYPILSRIMHLRPYQAERLFLKSLKVS